MLDVVFIYALIDCEVCVLPLLLDLMLEVCVIWYWLVVVWWFVLCGCVLVVG